MINTYNPENDELLEPDFLVMCAYSCESRRKMISPDWQIVLTAKHSVFVFWILIQLPEICFADFHSNTLQRLFRAQTWGDRRISIFNIPFLEQ